MDLPAVVLRDGPAFAASALGLLGVVGLAEVLHRAGAWTAAAARRTVHAATGLFVVLTPYLFEAPHLLYLLAVLFVVLNAAALRRRWFRGIEAVGRRSLGTVTFPLALLVALLLCWSLDPGRRFTLQAAFLILAVADPLAAWVGTRRVRTGLYRLGVGVKSFAGSLSFFASAFALTLGACATFRAAGVLDWGAGDLAGAALLTAAATTAVEALSQRGWDNFFIVVAALVVLVRFDEHPEARELLLASGGLGLAFGILAWQLRLLDASGAVAGGLLAASLLAAGGLAWAVPAFTFFLLSSLLSRVGRRRKALLAARTEKGSVRDAGQVYANGGVGWGLLLLYGLLPAAPWYWGFLGAFAAAAADTWATELGTLAPGRPRLITSGRRVPPGTSGAVSAPGTLGALAGAASVWLSALPFAPALGSPAGAVAVVLGGLAAAFVDSLLGATLQARYRDAATGQETERSGGPGVGHSLIRGQRWMNNDRVNLAGTLSGALLAMAGYLLTAGP